MKTVATNRRARFDYEISDTFDAGVVLTGHEAKSIKMGRFNITGSHVVFRDEEAYLVGAQITSFQPGNEPDGYDSYRPRKLLLQKKVISSLIGKIQDGLTVIPLRAYIGDRNLIKIELGLGKKKKKQDKREALKKRATERDINRTLRG